MKIERYTTAEGWPGVRWEQEVPSGWTWYSIYKLVQWTIGIGLGLGVFSLVLSEGVSLGWSLFWGGVVVFAVVAPEAWNRIGANLEGKGGGGAGTPEALRERLARWKAQVIYRREKLWAELVRVGKELVMTVGGARGTRGKVGLEKLVFELGTEEEWFGDAAGRELSRLGHTPGCWVIVVPMAEDGVVKVAASGRDKAGITKLHGVLTNEFVGKRRELNRRLAEMMG